MSHNERVPRYNQINKYFFKKLYFGHFHTPPKLRKMVIMNPHIPNHLLQQLSTVLLVLSIPISSPHPSPCRHILFVFAEIFKANPLITFRNRSSLSSGKSTPCSGTIKDWKTPFPFQAHSPIQAIQKEISPEYSLEGLMLKLKLQYFGHLMQRTDSLKKTPVPGKIEGWRRRG